MASSARIDELRKKFDENPRRYFAPLANEYRKAGDLEQAVFICQEYLPQQPGHMSGHIVYGQTLFEMGRNDEAQVVFETALSLDPENLIALRHLGDIARITGDSNGARIWYQRVLEADPRNEEIAQLMISLLAAPEPPAPVAAATPAAPATPVSTATARPEPSASAAADSGAGLVVEKSQDDSELREAPPPAPVMPPEPPTEPPPPRHTTAATKAGDGQDFLSLDDFDIGGGKSAPPASNVITPPTADSSDEAPEEPFEALSIVEAFRAPPGTPVPAAAPPAVTATRTEATPARESEPEPEMTEEGTFELGTEDGPFEADPYAVARHTDEPVIEPATDITLGLVNVDSIPVESSGVPAASEPPVVDGLESFEAGMIADVPDEVPVFETESFFDTAAVESSPIDGGHAGDEAPPSPNASAPAMEEPASAAPAPQAFVTETMAELYLRQGHLDSALEIYRQLVDQRPDDAELADRLRGVEDQVYGAPATIADDAAPASPVYGGPTIREFLLGLASRRTPLAVDAVPEPPYEPAFEDEGAFAPSSEPPRHTQSDETVRGSIDALFSEADASSSDAHAATALREAFAPEGPETAPLQGMPAHRASSELSLDHVFKGNSPPPADGDGFSFDQFFAEEMSDGAPDATADAGANPTEATDDIAQFNAWLNGLKKT